ncbi:MAG: O-antigen ligase family protein [Dinoroseobacter sp.]|nr:O-antigen ligase family protein [Dinoroseobacter sp.]
MSFVEPISTSYASNQQAPAKRLEFYLAVTTVALSPMNYFRLEAAYFTAGDLFGFMTLVVMLLNRSVPLRFYGPATPLWLFSLLLFLGGLLLGSIVQGDPIAGLVVFLQYCYSLIVIPIIISCRRLEETFLLMRVLIAAIAVIMLFGAFLIAFVPDAGPRLISGSGRLRSLLERENAAGAMAAIAIMFSVYLRMVGMFRLLYFIPVLGVLIYGLMLTGSNTGFGATVLGVGTILLLVGGIRAILAAIVIAIIGGQIVLQYGDFFLPEVFQRRVFGALSSGDIEQAGTFADRFELLHEAVEFSNETLWLGFGADQYRVFSDHGAPVHNTYLLILSEGGIVSLLGLCGFFLSGLALGIGAYTAQDSRARGALTLAMVILLAAVFNSFAHFYARFWHVPLAIAMSLSLPRAGQSTYR